jgi:hypothetical protein
MYKPIIRYEVNEHPYLQVDLGDLPPKLQEELTEGIKKIMQNYHVCNKRTKDWLQRADDLNKEWRKQHQEDLGCLLNSSTVLK